MIRKFEPGQAEWKVPPGPCGVCGVSGPRVLHHVVEKQEVRRRGGRIYDQANGLPIGAPYIFGGECRCHERHTNAHKRIPLAKIPPAALAFAEELLGDYADDYLHRYYR